MSVAIRYPYNFIDEIPLHILVEAMHYLELTIKITHPEREPGEGPGSKTLISGMGIEVPGLAETVEASDAVATRRFIILVSRLVEEQNAKLQGLPQDTVQYLENLCVLYKKRFNLKSGGDACHVFAGRYDIRVDKAQRGHAASIGSYYGILLLMRDDEIYRFEKMMRWINLIHSRVHQDHAILFAMAWCVVGGFLVYLGSKISKK